MDNARNFIEKPVLAIYVTCFSIGVFTHGHDFIRLGWRPYAWGPPVLEAFWTSLILLDTTVIMMLALGRRKQGLVLAAAIMAFDVAANSYAHFILEIPGFTTPLILQACFFGFVLGSVAFLWPRDPT